MKPKFSYTEGLFYKIWLAFCLLIILAAVSSSILVYIQVSSQLTNHMKQRLLWEANYYRLQLDEVFVQASQKLDGLVRSSAAASADLSLLQSEMNALQINSASMIRCWVAYPDGKLIPAPGTRFDYVRNLPWWNEYLSGRIPKNFGGLIVGRGQSLVGKPFIDPNGTALVPLLCMELKETSIIRAAGAELDLGSVLADEEIVNGGWSDLPVSVYTNDGILVANPYLENRGQLKLLERPSDNPLIRQMLVRPNEISGFKIYHTNMRQMAGFYLKDPSLGLVLMIEYPAAMVVDPIRQIALGPLVVVVFLLLIATIVVATIYKGTKQLRQTEQLARSAEWRALQAHINPHFLFNTLDQMVGIAATENPKALTQAIKSLANLFRYTTRQTGEWVTLEEELNYLKEYVSLQQIRYRNRFSFDLLVPENLTNIKVLKFCIQPLVENCFVHGVEKSLDVITIQVRVEQNGNEINIHVKDDGPGILTERLNEITESLNKESYESSSQNHGVGLSNIHHRIRYAYGNSYGVALERLAPGFAVHLKFSVNVT